MKNYLMTLLIMGVILVPVLASAQMMGLGWSSWSMMGVWGILGLVFNIIIWAFIIWGIIALVRWATKSGHGNIRDWRGEDSAAHILKERYARGEINKQEFEEKMKDITK